MNGKMMRFWKGGLNFGMALALSGWSSSWILAMVGTEASIFSPSNVDGARFATCVLLYLGVLSLWHRILDVFFVLVEPRPRLDASDVCGSVVARMMVERLVRGGRLVNNIDARR